MSPGAASADRERLLDLLAAVSLANLCLLLVWRELLYANALDRYWMVDFSGRHYVAALVNLTWLSAAFYLGARALRRVRSWPARAALILMLLAALMAPANYARLALKFDEREIFQIADHWLYMAAIAVAMILVAWLVARNGRRTLLGLRVLLIVFSPFAVMNFAEAAWAAATLDWRRPASAETTSSAVKSPARPRVVWLIFDELDWRLGFAERPARVHMPEFTRLAETSVVANGAESTTATMSAIPSLTTGKRVKDAHRLDDRHVQLDFEDGGEGRWAAGPNVFSASRKMGAHTEIVGFYHPYCRIFAGQYDRCTALAMDVAHMDPDEPFGSIVFSQLVRLLPVSRRISAIWMFKRLAAQTASAVANPANDFVYAHVSVPHGPNIWSSASHSFTVANLRKDGYFENLELADRLLGEIRRSLEAASLWDATAVVATADHGWRHVDLIGEKRDRRVPILVKLPGQHARYDVEATVDAAETVKRVVLGILAGEIRDPAKLQAKLSGEWRTSAVNGR
jgi:hypothetical protein